MQAIRIQIQSIEVLVLNNYSLFVMMIVFAWAYQYVETDSLVPHMILNKFWSLKVWRDE